MLCALFLIGGFGCGFDLVGFDMGGCFPCFGSSDEEGSGVKEVTKDSVREGSATHSHHVNRVNSGGNFFSF